MHSFMHLLAGLAFVGSMVDASATENPKAPTLESLIDTLRASEFHVSTSASGTLTAPNRAQDLRVTFDADGLRVAPRSRDRDAFTWGLAFAGIGRRGALEAPRTATPRAHGARVEYDRGSVVEWYVNDERGVEHGFTIDTRVAGEGDLVLALGVRGSLAPREAERGIDFVAADGSVAIRYDHLHVFDAEGVTLPAALRADASNVYLEVDDRDARYPITIDPLATSPSWDVGSGQGFSGFGLSVASAGDVNGDGFADVIVGAPYFDQGTNDEGMAFVFLGSANGVASTSAWSAEGNQFGALFGSSVASAGDVNGDGFGDVIVGAPEINVAPGQGTTHEGQAYVYLGSATGLATTPAWTQTVPQSNALFGCSVASAGDVDGDGFDDVVVGAKLLDNGQSNEGRAFLFRGSASGLAAVPAWTAESDVANAQFGSSVASAGDVNGDGFADVVVGAYNLTNGITSEGKAYQYLGSATGLAPAPAWTFEGSQFFALFGYSVASAGDVNGDGYDDVIVGAIQATGDDGLEGRAYGFHGSAGGLGSNPSWFAEGNQPNSRFGGTVASAGDVNGDGYADVIVGAEFMSNGHSAEGRASTFFGSAAGLAFTPAWTVEGEQDNAQFGVSVASAGDVNGDGFDDVIIGANRNANGVLEGRAVVFDGTAGEVCGSSLATSVPYGTGKAGTLGVPVLSSSAPPSSGTDTDVTISGGLPGVGPVALFVGLAPTSLAFDGGTLLVSPLLMITLPPLSPAGSLTLPARIPVNPGACGLNLYLQAMYVDPGAAGFDHTAQTQGLHWTIGS